MTKRKHTPTMQPDAEVRPIPGYEGLYSATADGRIWSHAKTMGMSRHGGRWLCQTQRPGGYRMVQLFKEQKAKMTSVHRAVALAWIPNDQPELRIQINHINGQPADNRVANLEWCTPSENLKHAYRTGLNRGAAKLTQEQADQARQRVRAGELARDVAASLEISPATMSAIKNGARYIARKGAHEDL